MLLCLQYFVPLFTILHGLLPPRRNSTSSLSVRQRSYTSHCQALAVSPPAASILLGPETKRATTCHDEARLKPPSGTGPGPNVPQPATTNPAYRLHPARDRDQTGRYLSPQNPPAASIPPRPAEPACRLHPSWARDPMGRHLPRRSPPEATIRHRPGTQRATTNPACRLHPDRARKARLPPPFGMGPGPKDRHLPQRRPTAASIRPGPVNEQAASYHHEARLPPPSGPGLGPNGPPPASQNPPAASIRPGPGPNVPPPSTMKTACRLHPARARKARIPP
uniref:Uncharacterized protein n=1 Tax=Pipistrellus kuhlii TaxID=59472 RepID=A0A7J7TP75_PIPKU|nr:hypothetical protein mPipKuh1_009304 [Pipistrellus kuhlii]